MKPLHVIDLTTQIRLTRLGTHPDGTGPRVDGVALVDTVQEARNVPANFVMMLAPSAAGQGWKTDTIVRLAWERAVACVILPGNPAPNPFSIELADKLGVALFMTGEDLFAAAIELARLLSAQDRSEGLIAAAARTLAGVPHAPGTVLAALQRVLPTYELELAELALSSTGPPVPAPPGAPGDSARFSSDETTRSAVIDVTVSAPESPLALSLSARPRPGAGSLPQHEVREVLELAVAPLTVWLLRRSITPLRSARADTELMQQFLAHPSEPAVRDRLSSVGWPFPASLFVAVVAPRTQAAARTLDAALRDRWLSLEGWSPPVRLDGIWMFWLADANPPPAPRVHEPGGSDDAGPSAQQHPAVTLEIREALEQMHVDAEVVVGVSGPFGKPSDIPSGLNDAKIAARLVAALPTRGANVAHIDEFGDDTSLISAIPGELGELARRTLAPLTRIDRDGTLFPVLLAALEIGEHPADIAASLGIHRNTVTMRLRRIRESGIGYGDPRRLFLLHLSVIVLATSAKP